MQFKKWLIESRFNDMHSWLDVSGEFHPVTATTHSDDAVKYSDYTNSAEAKDDLMKRGWQRVSHYNHILYVANPIVAPNRVQKSELVDLALTRDLRKVVYDNDVSEIVLWDASEKF